MQPGPPRDISHGVEQEPTRIDEHGLRPPPAFSVREERRGAAMVLRLAGEVDVAASGAVRARVDAAAGGALVVDLAEVTFIDSTVLGLLVEARAKLGDGEAFALAAPGLEVRRALEVSGLDRHFAVHETIETAIE